MSKHTPTQSSLLGPVPVGWKLTKLGTVLKERREQGRLDLPLLSITAGQGIVHRDTLEKRDTSNSDKSKYLRIAAGDIGYNTMRMWQGVSAISRFEGIVSPAYTICVPTEDIFIQYMKHLFKYPVMINVFARYSQGMVDDTLSLKYDTFAKIEVPLPNLETQQRIANILDAADEAVQASAELVAQLETFKRGTMQELLLRGLPGRHDRFQQTEVGEIPEGWEVRKLDSLGHIQAGRQRSPHHVTGAPRPYLRVANVFDGRIDTEDVFNMPFTDQEFSRYKLHAGDILLNEGQSLELVGRPAMYLGAPEECCFQNTLVRFRSKSEIDAHYALKLFQHFLYSGRFMAIAKRTTSIAHLGVSRFADLKVALPPLPEQREIVSLLSAFDQRIQIERARGAQLEQVKRGLAQGLLSGKLPVDVPEEVAAP